MRATLFLLTLITVDLAAAQVRLDNATVERHSAAPGLERTFRSIVDRAPVKPGDSYWIAYTVPVVNGDRVMCCFDSDNSTWSRGGVFVGRGDRCCGGCRLEPGTRDPVATGASQRLGPAAVPLESSRFSIFYRIVGGTLERVRVFSEQCAVDAGGRVVHWLDDVKPAESVALLMSMTAADKRVLEGAITAIALHDDPSADAALDALVARDRPDSVRKKAAFWMGQARGRRGFETLRRLVADDPSVAFRKSAVFALSQTDEPEAIPAVITIARKDVSPEVRGEALFWLGQKAGRKAAEAITDAIENDPETAVKKKAVFALSQLPKDEGVPLLIQVAKTNRNPAVRKQAIFWLGQSRDARALAFFEEVLKDE
jgi:HEAT repeat protein